MQVTVTTNAAHGLIPGQTIAFNNCTFYNNGAKYTPSTDTWSARKRAFERRNCNDCHTILGFG